MPKPLTTPIACLLVALLLPGVAWAGNPQVGETIGDLVIEHHGELLLDKKGEARFRPWSTHNLADGQRMNVLLYLAATLGASRINQPFTEALDQAAFPPAQVRATSIVNVSETPWGAIGFALKELMANKKRHPAAVLVADTLGVGREAWSLKPNSYAVCILDPQGNVLFFKDGALTPAEINTALQLLRDGIQTLPGAVKH